MKEEFLHYVWQYQLFSHIALKTSLKEEVVVVKPGIYNRNSGPDFLQAHVQIGGQLWVGNVEIHLKSSDWYAHHHEQDANYDAVILHVVLEHDATVFMKRNRLLPTILLKDRIAKGLLEQYQTLFAKQQRWIACENQISNTDKFIIKNWLERLYVERLEEKSKFINELLKTTHNDYESVLFQLLAKNFGLKVNGAAFLHLAQSFDFSLVRKLSFDEDALTALFFGQAGFLTDEIEEGYYVNLQDRYRYLQHKYRLVAIDKEYFQFFRMRPQNFPTIRIAQLAALYYKEQQLFSKVMEVQRLEEFYELFSVMINDFWNTHYTFRKQSKKSSKKISKTFIELLLINTILPLKYVYLKSFNVGGVDSLLAIVEKIAPERNAILTKFMSLEVEVESALESQALLTLKNEYCVKKRCLECAIGNYLLRK